MKQVSVAVLIDKFVSASAIIKMEKQELEAMQRKNKEVCQYNTTPPQTAGSLTKRGSRKRMYGGVSEGGALLGRGLG